jgi:hypothetical protein
MSICQYIKWQIQDQFLVQNLANNSQVSMNSFDADEIISILNLKHISVENQPLIMDSWAYIK